MLVLTRKKQQSLMLGKDIEVQVLDVTGDQVRLGITAPAAIRILRRELLKEIEQSNAAAAASLAQDGRWEALRNKI